jgi:hypothetical protein
MKPGIIDMAFPEYRIDAPPDFEAIGKKIDTQGSRGTYITR